jgi:hypothetical protein
LPLASQVTARASYGGAPAVLAFMIKLAAPSIVPDAGLKVIAFVASLPAPSLTRKVKPGVHA